MAEKLITKSFERLLDKGKHRGFITYEELSKSLGKRNSTNENIDAKVIKKLTKDNLYELSVKDLEIQEEKKALKEYGSSTSGASIGDIIGAALDKDNQKNKKKLNNEKK